MAQIIEMPKLSDTMTTGTLVHWLVKEGEAVTAGKMLAEVETDKATMEVENFEDGVVLKLYVQEGESVAIGQPICAVGEKGEKAPEAGGGGQQAPQEAKKADKAENAPEAQQQRETPAAAPQEVEAKEPTSGGEGERVKASPLARKIAEEKGLDLSRIQGTGPGGRIVKSDVESAKPGAPAPEAKPAAKPAPAPVARLEDTVLPVTTMRAAIARTLVASKTEAPHFYLTMEVDGEPLTLLREQLNGKLAELPAEAGGIKFTVNDLILKAAVEAVRRVPAINRAWKGKEIVQSGAVHVAFGVAIDDGLLTPVIRDAQAKSLRQMAVEAKELIGKARNKKLKPEEMQGSTLTVTNLGMYGIKDFYGIINPPNAAILSIGATLKQPVVKPDDTIGIGYRMSVGLSGDHRVIDGALGAQYLAALRDILETPALILL